MADSPFLIVGGGIAGLGMALGLARIGKFSHVLEKAPTFDAIGAGLQLGPNAVRALQWLGAWDAVSPHCVAPAEIHVRDGISGNILQRIPLGAIFEQQFGAPYQVAHRADLQKGLLESVRSKNGIELQIHAEVTNVSIAETTLTLKSGIELMGEAIIAADGVHSMVRKHLTGQIGYRPKGHTLFRSLAPMNSIPSSANVDVVTLWLCPGGHVVHYAVSNRQKFNIVAAVENSAASLDSTFHRACKPLGDLINSQDQWSTWSAVDIDPVQNWNRNRTVLIGDAAHASQPYLAQGAAMAFEDACVLSGMLGNTDDCSVAFQEFSKLRSKRTSSIQKRSRQLGTIYHARGALRLARNTVLKIASPHKSMKQLSWIYSWKADGK